MINSNVDTSVLVNKYINGEPVHGELSGKTISISDAKKLTDFQNKQSTNNQNTKSLGEFQILVDLNVVVKLDMGEEISEDKEYISKLPMSIPSIVCGSSAGNYCMIGNSALDDFYSKQTESVRIKW